VRAPEGTSLEQTRVIMARIAREIRQLNGVQYTLLNVSDSMRRQANRGIMYVRLLTPTERQFRQLQIMDFVRREVLPHYASEKLRLNVSQVEEIGAGPSSALIQYVIGGPDFKKLEACAEIIKTKLHEMPGVVDIDSNIMGGKPQYGVRVDRDRAEDLGVPVVEIARTLRLLVAGEKVSTFNERGEEYDINVRAAAQFRNDIDELRRATVATLTRGPVPLGDVVRISEGTGPAQINRLNRARQVTVYANLTPGTSQQEVLDVIKQTIQEQNLGPSYFSTPMGQSKELGKTMTAFGTAFLMAFIFMFLVLAAQFESWLHPITIMMSLPITLPFALVSLFLFHQSLNVLSLLGLLVLFAVVKKNAILQIDHTNQLRADGLERYEAIITANRHRLRPILMTTVAFIAGMVPLLISKDTGASMNRTISSVVIGGQSLSLLITLIAIPVAYTFFDDITQFLSRISRRIRGGSVEK
jgi:HAE1 family hydrophobic/amphiphilic exporter-1